MKASNLFFNSAVTVYGRKYEEVLRGRFDKASLEKLEDEYEVVYDDFDCLAIKLTLKPSPICGFKENVGIETGGWLEVDKNNSTISFGDKIKKEDIIVICLKQVGGGSKKSFKLTDEESDKMTPFNLVGIPHFEVVKEDSLTDEELTSEGFSYTVKYSPMGIAELVIASDKYGMVNYPLWGELKDSFSDGESLDITNYKVCMITRKYKATALATQEYIKKNSRQKDPLTRVGIYLSLK
jgi:hypothetical protein